MSRFGASILCVVSLTLGVAGDEYYRRNTREDFWAGFPAGLSVVAKCPVAPQDAAKCLNEAMFIALPVSVPPGKYLMDMDEGPGAVLLRKENKE